MSNSFQLKINEIIKGIPKIMKRLPGVVKVEGLRFIADNFKNQGFEKRPGQVDKWKEKQAKGARKNTLMGEKRGGSLKRSWQQETTASATQVEFTSSLPYAAVHNEGLQAGRPPGFTMTQRQMIGDSEALTGRIEAKLDRMMEEVLK